MKCLLTTFPSKLATVNSFLSLKTTIYHQSSHELDGNELHCSKQVQQHFKTDKRQPPAYFLVVLQGENEEADSDTVLGITIHTDFSLSIYQDGLRKKSGTQCISTYTNAFFLHLQNDISICRSNRVEEFPSTTSYQIQLSDT